MLEQEPGVSQTEVQAESARPVIEGDAVEVAGYRRQRRPHPGRQSLPAELPRVEKVIACPAEQCVCGQCGQVTTVIGYEASEQLEVEPAKYFVLVTKREKGKSAPVRAVREGGSFWRQRRCALSTKV